MEDVKDTSTDVSNLPALGAAQAPVVLIEVSDFQCPYCARYADDTFSQIEREFVSKGHVQYFVRQLPLEPLHPFAFRAAQAANCAGHQGAFWGMRRHLFRNRDKLGDSLFLKSPTDIGVDGDVLADCLKETDDPLVRKDQAEAARLAVRSTPTFFVGRRTGNRNSVQLLTRINGALPYADFRDALNRVIEM